MPVNSRIPGLKDSSAQQRRKVVAERTGLSDLDVAVFDPEQGLGVAQADHMIENVVGVMGIPVGVATNFTSTAATTWCRWPPRSRPWWPRPATLARMARVHGGFHTSSTDPVMQAQIQILDVADPEAARLRLLEARDELLALANAQDPALVRFGGGARDLTVRLVPTRTGTHVVIHLHVDVRDAMGANAVNTMAEAIAPRRRRDRRRSYPAADPDEQGRPAAHPRPGRVRRGPARRRRGGRQHRARLRARRSRSLPGRDPQQGHHERHHRRRPGDRQRHPRGRGGLPLARGRRGRPLHRALALREGPRTATWSAPSSCRWPVGLVGGATKVHPVAQASGEDARRPHRLGAGRRDRSPSGSRRTWAPAARWPPRASNAATCACTPAPSPPRPAPPATNSTSWSSGSSTTSASASSTRKRCSPTFVPDTDMTTPRISTRCGVRRPTSSPTPHCPLRFASTRSDRVTGSRPSRTSFPPRSRPSSAVGSCPPGSDHSR